MKIKVAKAEDRDTMIVILARNGYTVRQGKEKRAGEKTITYYVEVIEDGQRNPTGNMRSCGCFGTPETA